MKHNATLEVPQVGHSDNSRKVIHAELIGGDTCAALGIVVKANTPVLELCRKLIAAGHNPATRLEAYRGSTLCIRVRSISESARLEISHHGVGFVARYEGGTAPSIRQIDGRGK